MACSRADSGQVRVQPRERRAQVADQHDLALVSRGRACRAARRSRRCRRRRSPSRAPSRRWSAKVSWTSRSSLLMSVKAMPCRPDYGSGQPAPGCLAILDQLAVAHHHHGGASLPRNLPGTSGGASNAAGAACMSASGRRDMGCAFMDGLVCHPKTRPDSPVAISVRQRLEIAHCHGLIVRPATAQLHQKTLLRRRRGRVDSDHV